jgi:tRNA(fMet)-specific endonuclease VapC
MYRRMLDTNTLSEIVKGRNRNVAKKAEAYFTQHTYYTVSAITIAEIVYGYNLVNMAKELREFSTRMESLEILHLDSESGFLAGKILAELEKSGKHIGYPDTWIAAIAIANRLPLVTANTSDFLHIVDLGYDLALEDWTK